MGIGLFAAARLRTRAFLDWRPEIAEKLPRKSFSFRMLRRDTLFDCYLTAGHQTNADGWIFLRGPSW